MSEGKRNREGSERAGSGAVDGGGSERGLSRGVIGWMAHNSVAANLLMLVVLGGGLVALFQLKQEVFPEFDLDMVTVRVAYPGASPEDVEQGIVLAVEEAVRGVDGVKRVTATAQEGAGVVNVELLLGANPDQVLADVKSAVDRIVTFPEEAEKPVVSLATRKREVISLIISGDQDLRTLHAIAEEARNGLLRSPDITQVELTGVPPLEVSVEVPRETLESLGLTLEEIARQIRAASLELPGGTIETDSGHLLVRLADRRRQGPEFADIIIKSTRNGAEVRLGDVATIRDGYADTDQASFYNGKPAVRLTAYRVGKETPTQVATAVRAYARKLEASLPDTVNVAVWGDRSTILQARIDLLVSNALYGLILVVIVLAIFLEARVAFWVALGIPASFMGAFLLMSWGDLSINMITLFALIITLGMVVDDAIVVGENVYEKIQAGVPRLKAAVLGAREMVVPVVFSVLTSMVAFSPMLMVPGVMGKIFRFIPLVVIFVLGVSLAESFLVLPAHLGHGRVRTGGRLSAWFDRVRLPVTRAFRTMTVDYYVPLARVLIRHRVMTMAAAISLLVAVVGLVASGHLPFRFFPKLEGDQVTVTARFPYGTPIARTNEARRALEAAANRAIERAGGKRIVRGMFTRLGEGGEGHWSAGEIGSHLVTIELDLVPTDQRPVSSQAFAEMWEEEVPEMPGLISLVFGASYGPGAGAAVDVQLSHTDMGVLEQASEALAGELRSYPGLTNIDNSFAAGKPQLDFHLLPNARTLGLTGNDIARQLRSAFFGAEALREQRGRNELKVMVRLPERQRRSEFDLEQFQVRTPAGSLVPLNYVADFDRGRAPTKIRRESGRRIVNVSAELASGTRSSREILDSLTTGFLPRLRDRFPGLDVTFVGQQREQKETFSSLGRNFLLIQFVIFAMLAVPFKSYIQPIVVMSAIPFGIVGALLGHVVMGYAVGLISIMGIVALTGVVVNDSLVLIDTANRLRAQGLSSRDAIVQAGMRRMRPVFLTSITTFLGLAPMIFEPSVQARFLIPMAISLGYGVMFGTVIVLIIVPALYTFVEDIREWARGRKDVEAPATVPTSPQPAG